MVGTVQPGGVDLASVGDYKRGLYDKLSSTGILDNLKSHLRTRILSKLQGQDNTSLLSHTSSRDRLGSEGGLISRVLDSLFTDYLRNKGYDYTLSVFLPESGIQSTSALSLGEILQMLHIHESSPIAQVIRDKREQGPSGEEESDRNACLSTLLLGSLAEVSTSKPLHEAETQTWELSGGKSESNLSVAIEVGRIEARMQDKLESERASLSAIFETKMNDYRRDLEIRTRADVQAQVERVRDIETRSIRIQESAKAWENLAKEKEELDKVHNERLAALKSSELEMMQRITEKWRSIETKEGESRAVMSRQREQIVAERERFDVEITERRTGIERREKALDERVNAVQVKQIEAEKLLDFAAQQLEQARLLKVRSLDVKSINANQPSSPEIAMEMLDSARKEASQLRKKLIEETRDNEELRKKVQELESEIETLVPRETLNSERRSWLQEREALLVRESTLKSALKRANMEMEEAVAGQEGALNELEEAKVRASMATREASDLRSYARELQFAFDSNVQQHRYSFSSDLGRRSNYSSAFEATQTSSRLPVSSTVNVQELEEVEQGLRNRLESFKSRNWSERPQEIQQIALPTSKVPGFLKASMLQPQGLSRLQPQEEIVGSGQQSAERDYVRESQRIVALSDTKKEKAGSLPSLQSDSIKSGVKNWSEEPGLESTFKATKTEESTSASLPSTSAIKDDAVTKTARADADVDIRMQSAEASRQVAEKIPALQDEESSSPKQKQQQQSFQSPPRKGKGKMTQSSAETRKSQSPRGQEMKASETSLEPTRSTTPKKEEEEPRISPVKEKAQKGSLVATKQVSPIEIPGEREQINPSQTSPTLKEREPAPKPEPEPSVQTPPKDKDLKSAKASEGTKVVTKPKSTRKSSKERTPSPSKKSDVREASPKKQVTAKKQQSKPRAISKSPKSPKLEESSTGKSAEQPSRPEPSTASGPDTSKVEVKDQGSVAVEKGKQGRAQQSIVETKGEEEDLKSPSSSLNPSAKPYVKAAAVSTGGYSPSWSPKASPEKTPRASLSKSPIGRVQSEEKESAEVSSKSEISTEVAAFSPSKVTPSKEGQKQQEVVSTEEEKKPASPSPVTEKAETLPAGSPSADYESSPYVAPFKSPVQAEEKSIESEEETTTSKEEVPLSVAQILTQAAMEEQMSDDAEEVDSDINSTGSLSPRHSSGDSFGAAEAGFMGVLPRETPEHSPLGPPIGEPSEDLNINYSEIDDIRVGNMSDDDEISVPDLGIQSEELSVASFSGPSTEGSNLSIPGLSSEGSVF